MSAVAAMSQAASRHRIVLTTSMENVPPVNRRNHF